jgi:hypothetical protein
MEIAGANWMILQYVEAWEAVFHSFDRNDLKDTPLGYGGVRIWYTEPQEARRDASRLYT